MSKKHNTAAANAVQVVFCACPDTASADKIATALVDKGLAACANRISGVVSTYRWDDKLCRNVECLLMIKTTAEAIREIEGCIKAIHPYELPEIIAVPCTGGSADYLKWVTASTKPAGSTESGRSRNQ